MALNNVARLYILGTEARLLEPTAASERVYNWLGSPRAPVLEAGAHRFLSAPFRCWMWVRP